MHVHLRNHMNPNRVSATLPTADQEAVMSAIEAIRQKLPFLIDLTSNEPTGMAKLGGGLLTHDH